MPAQLNAAAIQSAGWTGSPKTRVVKNATRMTFDPSTGVATETSPF